MIKLETCPGCKAILPVLEGAAIHRYMTSSAACWATFNALNDPERPLAPAEFNNLIVDAYAVQHPGTPSDQTINSVAIHLMVLYGVLDAWFCAEPSAVVTPTPRAGQKHRETRQISLVNTALV